MKSHKKSGILLSLMSLMTYALWHIMPMKSSVGLSTGHF